MDPDLVTQVVATHEAYAFRLAIIKGAFFTFAVVLMVTVLVLLLEDFFDEE